VERARNGFSLCVSDRLDVVAVAVAVEAAWAGGVWIIRVEDRKKAKEARRMVNDRRSFRRDLRVFWEVDRNNELLKDCEEDESSILRSVMLMEVLRR